MAFDWRYNLRLPYPTLSDSTHVPECIRTAQ
ncbi:MAG TPA: hypothetical protein [Caudoviricetes sp.]|nr:MAG TPA: hypothetical protein [Caudoviricetes sp.]